MTGYQWFILVSVLSLILPATWFLLTDALDAKAELSFYDDQYEIRELLRSYGVSVCIIKRITAFDFMQITKVQMSLIENARRGLPARIFMAEIHMLREDPSRFSIFYERCVDVNTKRGS